nr:unnamed protein product [Callosobruchus analis]
MKPSASTGIEEISSNLSYQIPLKIYLIAPFPLVTSQNDLRSQKLYQFAKMVAHIGIVQNYRPISLQKLTKLIAIRLTSFLLGCQIPTPHQFSFQKAKFTADAEVDYLNILFSQLDCGMKAHGLFINLSKTFDLVDHDILCCKLDTYAQSGVKCVKCDTVTHRGCLKYLKNVTIIDSDLIVCCEDVPVIPVGCDSDSPFFDAIDHQADDNKVDVRIFHYIVKQKDMLIKELYDKNDLLNEKIKFLHEKGDTSAAIKTSTIKTTGSTGTSPQQVAAAILQEQTKLKFSDIINLANDTNAMASTSTDAVDNSSKKSTSTSTVVDRRSGDWKTVENKRRRRNTVVGKREDTEVKGVPKLAQLHVYRISKETTVECLTMLLQKNFPEAKCEAITPKHPEFYKSFKVRIYEHNFKKAMDADVWPIGACVSQENTQPSELNFNPKVLVLNVRCVSVSKFNSLVIDAQTFDVDFLCLTETWFTSNSVNSFHHDDFTLASCYYRTNFKGGGVAMYARNGIICRKLDTEQFYIEKEFESCCISVTTEIGKTVILCCYRSPNSDFNLDSSNDSPEYKRLSCILNNFNLTSRVKWPTRVTYHTSSTIDHIFSNCPDDAVTCVLDNDISDHRTILFDYCSGSSDNVPNITLRRSFDNQSLFSTDMMQENWSNLYQINDVSLAYAAFFNTFMHYFNKHFPKKRRSTQNKKQNRWSNRNIVRSSNNLKDLYCLKMCYPELEDIYKKAKTNHKRLISFTKKLYYQDKISLSDNPVKAAWNTIHELSNKPKRGGNNISISHNNIIIDGKKDVAEHFNEYFYNSPINISNSIGYIPSQGRDNKSLSNTNHVSQTLFLFPYTQAELINILYRKMKNKFSCGFDEVPMYLVKQVLHIIIDPITHLVNLSFTNGTFPDSLKVGKLIPTHKKGDIQCVENYRPIVMPSAFSKTFEYAFLHRLSGYIQKNNVISQNQHGFRENRSTDTAIHSFYGPLVKHMENGECPVGIFCDLTKAFDCVNHMILLDKLSNYGVRGNALKWISSFLEDRRQFVSVNIMNIKYNYGRCSRVSTRAFSILTLYK